MPINTRENQHYTYKANRMCVKKNIFKKRREVAKIETKKSEIRQYAYLPILSIGPQHLRRHFHAVK